MVSDEVLQTLAVMAELKGKVFSEKAVELFASDLEGYADHALLAALSRCRKELVHFPSVAEILERIDDGRPGPEEAWAMIPKDEEGSVVWTDEMRQAFGVCRPLLLKGDHIGARMAFKESYLKLLDKARASQVAPVWSPSLGQDKAQQAIAFKEAYEKGRLSYEHAQDLIPDLTPPSVTIAQLTGPVASDEPNLSGLPDVMERILDGADSRTKILARRPAIEKPFTEEDEAKRRQLLKEQAERLKAEEGNA